MIGYSWCRYVFEEDVPGKYIYRIELLDNWASHITSQKYINFLEESGVEHIASYQRWIYLRRKSSDGEFQVYSDIDSKIKYYKKVNMFWMTLAFAEMAIGFSNLIISAVNSMSNEGFILNKLNFSFGLLLVFLGIFFLLISRPIRKKIRLLLKDAEVHQ